MTKRTSIKELSTRLDMIERNYPDATLEEEAKVLRLLEERDALDLAGVLGLSVPQATCSESSGDVKVPL